MTISFDLLRALWRFILTLRGKRRICQHEWEQHGPVRWKCRKCPETRDAL